MALSLAGAFLCARAQAVIAALWPVNDEAVAELMPLFYAGLADGAELTEALRQARIKLSASYPLDGAAFQLWVGAG